MSQQVDTKANSVGTNVSVNVSVISTQDDAVAFSFYITYVLLMTTGVITLVEALRTADPRIRHILNLETCISIVATVFYGNFIEIMQTAQSTPNGNVDHAKISKMRYIDWYITTPMMLLVLCLVLAYNNDEPLHIGTYVIVVALDVLMLTFGYFGTVGIMEPRKALALGFVAFFAMFGFIWMTFLAGRVNGNSLLVFMLFFVFWSLYGVAYMLKERKKTISYNVLDLTAKCLVGLFLWAYLTKVFVV